MSDYIIPVGATLLPHVGGILGMVMTRRKRTNWFDNLQKPSWKPPSWVIPPIWTSLYTGMGYASYLVWRDGNGFQGDAALPLALYGTQLVINWVWAPIFFGSHKLGAALIDQVLLWGTAGACGYAFWTVNKTAGYLFIPYMGWLTIAAAVAYRIWKDNKDKID